MFVFCSHSRDHVISRMRKFRKTRQWPAFRLQIRRTVCHRYPWSANQLPVVTRPAKEPAFFRPAATSGEAIARRPVLRRKKAAARCRPCVTRPCCSRPPRGLASRMTVINKANSALAQIHMQIMWSRLIAVVEEQAQTLVRTAFSTSVREAGDLSAGVFDAEGRMLAQAVTGTPGHVNSMANAVKHFLAAYPLDKMAPGDHYITNDPWLTCGHLHDFTVVSPTFLDGKAVGLFAATVHVVDIGGLGMGPDGRQVFEEGLAVPIMPLAKAGRMNEDLLAILRANVREPLQVEGDIYALAACNDEGSRRLVDMMREFEINHLETLGNTIIESSRAATIEAIRKLPKGTYRNSLRMDGYDKPLLLNAALTIGDDGIHVDYAGTSPASAYGINVVYNYCLAYTAFGVKCVVAPEVPNNAGSLAPITVSAPEGCVLNVQRPWAVAARHTVGHMLPDLVFGCLHQVMPGGVPAEGASSLWNPQIYGGGSMIAEMDGE